MSRNRQYDICNGKLSIINELLTVYSAPGLKFGFSGEYIAITFGPLTTDTTLVSYRINGQDWQLTNITTNATHLFVSPSTPSVSLTGPIYPSTFELRVTNWAYGVQIAKLHVAKDQWLIKLPDYDRRIEVVGDSLSSGMYATLEGLSSFAYGLGAGLGNTEYSITAYPGICMFDKECWGNPRGMFHQWYYTSDTSGRSRDIWGDKPELWNFSTKPAADIVVICLGTNDANEHNIVTTDGYVAQYTMFIEGVHKIWPKSQIILVVSQLFPEFSSTASPVFPANEGSPSGVDSVPLATLTSKVVLSSQKSTQSMSTLILENISPIIFFMILNVTPRTHLTNPRGHSYRILTPPAYCNIMISVHNGIPQTLVISNLQAILFNISS